MPARTVVLQPLRHQPAPACSQPRTHPPPWLPAAAAAAAAADHSLVSGPSEHYTLVFNTFVFMQASTAAAVAAQHHTWLTHVSWLLAERHCTAAAEAAAEAAQWALPHVLLPQTPRHPQHLALSPARPCPACPAPAAVQSGERPQDPGQLRGLGGAVGRQNLPGHPGGGAADADCHCAGA